MRRSWHAVARRAGAVLMAIAGQAWLHAFQGGQSGFQTLTNEQLARQQDPWPAGWLVLIAYGIVWIVLLGYVFLLWRRTARVEQELAVVSQKLRERAGAR